VDALVARTENLDVCIWFKKLTCSSHNVVVTICQNLDFVCNVCSFDIFEYSPEVFLLRFSHLHSISFMGTELVYFQNGAHDFNLEDYHRLIYLPLFLR
jgi:hypothetical protein